MFWLLKKINSKLQKKKYKMWKMRYLTNLNLLFYFKKKIKFQKFKIYQFKKIDKVELTLNLFNPKINKKLSKKN
jgi:hypothetical protein